MVDVHSEQTNAVPRNPRLETFRRFYVPLEDQLQNPIGMLLS